MAVPIKALWIPKSKYKLKCPYKMEPDCVVVHNTYNSASAMAEASFSAGNNWQVSSHFYVDEKEIVQSVPLDRNAWHAGDGNGRGNRRGIAIEIARSRSDLATYLKAEDNAAWLVARLLKQYGWGIDRVKKHQDFSGKYCPHRMLDNKGWPKFLQKVQAYLNSGENKKEEGGMTMLGSKPVAIISVTNMPDLANLGPLMDWLYPSYNVVVTQSGKFDYSGIKANYIIGVGGARSSHTGYINYFISGKNREETKAKLVDFVSKGSKNRERYRV